jgi:tetratricopeptide (TPR) repeat protein
MRRGRGICAALLLSLAGSAAADEWRPAAGSPRSAHAYHLYSLAVQSLLDRDYAEAVRLLEEAVLRDPAPDLLVETARLYFSLNHTARAAELMEGLLERHPGIGEAHRLLGDIHLTRAGEEPDAAASLELAIREYKAALEADPSDDQASSMLAEIYYQSGRLEEAAAVLDRSDASRSPDSPQMLLRCKILIETGRHEEARPLLEQIMAQSPSNLEAADALAALYEQQGEFDAAIALYLPMLDDAGARGYLYERIGALQSRAGRHRGAIASLEEAWRLQPESSRACVLLAQAFERVGDTASALRVYDERIEGAPGDLEARFHRGRLLQQEGEFDAALAGFLGIVGPAGKRRVPSSEREAALLSLAYSQIGLILLNARDLEAAAGALGSALEVSPDPRPEMFLLLGRVELRRGSAGAAERVLEEARRRFPDDLELRILEGEALIVRGERPQAERFYRRLLDENGHPADGYVSVSEALLRQKLYEEADLLLEEGTLFHPANDRLYFARGAALERLGRIGEAERFLAKAIGLNPENAMALNYLGYMLADRGLRLEDSIAYIERALAMDPKNPAFLDSLGWALFKQSRYGPAEEHLRAAARYDRFDPTIREHLGDLLHATGRSEEALREWELALSNEPEEPERLREKVERARTSLGVE